MRSPTLNHSPRVWRRCIRPTPQRLTTWGVCHALVGEIERAGGEVLLGHAVSGIAQGPHGVTVAHGSLLRTFDRLVVCAGLQGDRVAQLAGLSADLRIIPFRGEYYVVLWRGGRPGARRDSIRYPTLRYPFLGVHLTRDVGDGVHVGPNAVLGLALEGYRRRDIKPADVARMAAWPGMWRLAGMHWRYGVGEMASSLSKRRYLAQVRKYLPDLETDDLVASGAGVRAQAVDRHGQMVDDFVLQDAGRIFLGSKRPVTRGHLEPGHCPAHRLSHVGGDVVTETAQAAVKFLLAEAQRRLRTREAFGEWGAALHAAGGGLNQGTPRHPTSRARLGGVTLVEEFNLSLRHLRRQRDVEVGSAEVTIPLRDLVRETQPSRKTLGMISPMVISSQVAGERVHFVERARFGPHSALERGVFEAAVERAVDAGDGQRVAPVSAPRLARGIGKSCVRARGHPVVGTHARAVVEEEVAVVDAGIDEELPHYARALFEAAVGPIELAQQAEEQFGVEVLAGLVGDGDVFGDGDGPVRAENMAALGLGGDGVWRSGRELERLRAFAGKVARTGGVSVA